ncbi:SNF2 family N-terminal domain-containing protein [Entophlyctis helioformis]|nr:SNF2 family N-terminal domain-containing protein [Entophlyctis helioformis]
MASTDRDRPPRGLTALKNASSGSSGSGLGTSTSAHAPQRLGSLRPSSAKGAGVTATAKSSLPTALGSSSARPIALSVDSSVADSLQRFAYGSDPMKRSSSSTSTASSAGSSFPSAAAPATTTAAPSRPSSSTWPARAAPYQRSGSGTSNTASSQDQSQDSSYSSALDGKLAHLISKYPDLPDGLGSVDRASKILHGNALSKSKEAASNRSNAIQDDSDGDQNSSDDVATTTRMSRAEQMASLMSKRRRLVQKGDLHSGRASNSPITTISDDAADSGDDDLIAAPVSKGRFAAAKTASIARGRFFDDDIRGSSSMNRAVKPPPKAKTPAINVGAGAKIAAKPANNNSHHRSRAINVSDDDENEIIEIKDDDDDDDNLDDAYEAQEEESAEDDRVLEFFNTSAADVIVDTLKCSRTAGDLVVSMRPYESVDDMRDRFSSGRSKQHRSLWRLVDRYESILEGYREIDGVIERCERVGDDLKAIMQSWISASTASASASASASGTKVDDDGDSRGDDAAAATMDEESGALTLTQVFRAPGDDEDDDGDTEESGDDTGAVGDTKKTEGTQDPLLAVPKPGNSKGSKGDGVDEDDNDDVDDEDSNDDDDDQDDEDDEMHQYGDYEDDEDDYEAGRNRGGRHATQRSVQTLPPTFDKTGRRVFKCLTRQPKTINKTLTLKQYQLVGVSWLTVLFEKQLGGILADEMGLGKTAQVITFLANLLLKGVKGPHLIIVPSSTLENWLREFKRWCPALRVRSYTGSQAERRELQMHLEDDTSYNVLVTTYNLATGSPDDRQFLKRIHIQSLILDEGHMVKNIESNRYKHLMALKSPFRLLLTGTPLQNNLLELLALLTFVMPKMFVKMAGTSDETALSRERIERAKKIMAPFVLRRRKDQVLRDLPNKRHELHLCTGTPSQMEKYQALLAESQQSWLSSVGDMPAPTDGSAAADTKLPTPPLSAQPAAVVDVIDVDAAESETSTPTSRTTRTRASGVVAMAAASSQDSSSQGRPTRRAAAASVATAKRDKKTAVAQPPPPPQPPAPAPAAQNGQATTFTANGSKRVFTNILMDLRKVANHPLLVRNMYTHDKLRIMSKKIIREPEFATSNLEYVWEDMMVMSDFELHKLCLKHKSIREYALPESALMDACKVKKLQEMLPVMIARVSLSLSLCLSGAGDRILIFSQFVIMLDLLEPVMEHLRIPYLRLDGSTPVAERQLLIDQYTNTPDIPVFLLSTKAGGFGINLTTANTVILYDIDYNPHNDAQAEDRAHRVGQTRDVTVHRLVMDRSIEMHILRLAHSKLSLDAKLQQGGAGGKDADGGDADGDNGKEGGKDGGGAGGDDGKMDAKVMDMLRSAIMDDAAKAGKAE